MRSDLVLVGVIATAWLSASDVDCPAWAQTPPNQQGDSSRPTTPSLMPEDVVNSLINKEIRDVGGQPIGKATDVLFYPRSGVTAVALQVPNSPLPIVVPLSAFIRGPENWSYFQRAEQFNELPKTFEV